MLSRYAFITLALVAGPAQALNVFTCQPDWAALVKEHAPDADVYSATTAYQDPHFIQARPSLIAKMRKADLVVCSGAEQEIGWLPELQRQSRNAKVANGAPGLFWVSDHVNLLDKPDKVDRAMGDVHASGNPHVQFAVAAMPQISRALTAKLAELDQANAADYQRRGQEFQQRWLGKMNVWRVKAQPLKGKKVVGYHATYRYLYDWLGIHQQADLEPKPGVSPTTAHLSKLAQLDAEGIYAIVYSTHQSDNAANWLAQRTGLAKLTLPQSVGGSEQAKDMFSLIDSSITALLDPLQGQQ